MRKLGIVASAAILASDEFNKREYIEGKLPRG